MGKIKIAVVDDHAMLRKGLAILAENLGYTVLFECGNGIELQQKIDYNELPDVVLMDINMPDMDGFETTLWLRNHYPLVNVLTLSMYDDDVSIIRMLKNGAKGYIMKESEPIELKRAIDDVMTKGIHYSELVTGKLLHSIYDIKGSDDLTKKATELSKNEIEFLKLVCTEMTYKEIANTMRLSPRTIDGYRDLLFEKLNIKNRVGLVLFAIKNNIFHIH